jgi:hypothetical protein
VRRLLGTRILRGERLEVARGAIPPAVRERDVALAPADARRARVAGEALEQLVAGGEHGARERVARGGARRARGLRGACPLVDPIRERQALAECELGDAVASGLRGQGVVGERGRFVAEGRTRLARVQAIRRRLGVVGPAREQAAVVLEGRGPVGARAVLRGPPLMEERDLRPRRARERGPRGAHRVRRLRPGPRAARREARRVGGAGIQGPLDAIGAAVRRHEPLGGDERVGVERIALEVQAVGPRGVGEQAEPPEVLPHRHEQPRRVRPRAHAVEVRGECRRASGARERVDEEGLGLLAHVDRARRELARAVEVEHAAERVGRLEEALAIELRPAQLV